MTVEEFNILPKNVQDFRWALFIESDGYKNQISKMRIKELENKFNI